MGQMILKIFEHVRKMLDTKLKVENFLDILKVHKLIRHKIKNLCTNIII